MRTASNGKRSAIDPNARIDSTLPGGAGADSGERAVDEPSRGSGESLNEATNDDVSSDASFLREIAGAEVSAPTPQELVISGSMLGPYRVLGAIGRGAMGVVYEAEDRQLQRRVALKVMALAHRGDEERRRRFLREARAASAVVHPNVAAVYGAGQDGGVAYFAMEHVRGLSLRDAIERRGGPLDIADAIRIGAAIAAGVAKAHELHIVHRDLKPENVMIAHDGTVKVLDFGLAKLLALPETTDDAPPSTHLLTLDGRVLGTPAYMSPEQAKGQAVTEASDVFSLGVVLYELVTGARPFRGHTAVELFIAIDRDEPARPSIENPAVPAAIEAIVLRCLRKAPEQRFADAGALAEALRNASSTDGAHEEPQHGGAPAARSAADAELRLASVVRVAGPAGDRAAAEQALTSAGATASATSDDAILGAFLQGPRGAGFATDLAAQAVWAALAARDASPGATIAIATGRVRWTPGDTGRGSPVFEGEAIDRATLLGRAGSPDQILLDELSSGLLDGRCTVKDLGSGVLALDAVSGGADATRPLLGKPTPCVGRDAELAMLDVALAASADDGSPRAVLVVASPGLGKTRLLHEWLRRVTARADAPNAWIGRADPVRGASGGLLAQALRAALGIAEGARPDQERELLLRAVENVVDPDEDHLRVAEHLGELCGVRFPDEGRAVLRSSRADPATMAEQVERAWLAWLGGAAARKPIVIVLEDLHWGDARTVALLDAALRRLPDSPFLVLALARPEIDDRFPDLWGGRAQRLPLAPLGKRASERLVREALGSEVDAALLQKIVRLSEGNALFLEELVRATAEGREAPGTLLAMLQARIEQLPSEERRVLRVASILGEQFRDSDVRVLLGSGGDEAGAWIRALAQREVLAAHREGAAPEHRFRHALVREAAYATLPENERRALHLVAADHLMDRAGSGSRGHGARSDQVEPTPARAATEARLIAEHLERGGRPERAAPHYKDAARGALERLELTDCIALVSRGIACGATGELLGVLLAIDSSAKSHSNQYEGVLARAQEAMSLVEPGSWAHCESAGIAIAAAMVQSTAEARDRIPQLMETMLRITPHADARRSYVRMLGIVLAGLCTSAPRCALEPMYRRLKAVCDDLAPSDPTASRWIDWALSRAVAIYEPAPWRAVQLAEKCLRDARAAGDRFVEHWALVWDHEILCWQLGDMGVPARLLRHHQQGVERRELALQAATAIQLARIACDTGDEAGLERGAAVMPLIAGAPGGAAFGVGLAYEHWARIELRRGRPAAALAERGRETLAFSPLYSLGPLSVWARALVADGRPRDAMKLAEEGLEILEAAGCGGYLEVDMRLSASEVFHAAGDHDRARAALRETLRQIDLRAADIRAPEIRESFLTKNADNVRAAALAAAWNVTRPPAPLPLHP